MCVFVCCCYSQRWCQMWSAVNRDTCRKVRCGRTVHAPPARVFPAQQIRLDPHLHATAVLHRVVGWIRRILLTRCLTATPNMSSRRRICRLRCGEGADTWARCVCLCAANCALLCTLDTMMVYTTTLCLLRAYPPACFRSAFNHQRVLSNVFRRQRVSG